MDNIYIIERAWTDNLTSMREPDFGYKVAGFVKTEDEAKKVCSSLGYFDDKELDRIFGARWYADESEDGRVARAKYYSLSVFKDQPTPSE